MNLIRPSHLNPGDRVRVVAASGPVDLERFEAGLRVLEKRYSPIFEESTLYARSGFLAGEDADRLAALQDAINDDESRAIFLARGGYGLLRLLDSIDPDLLRAHPKPIIGFSDVTALLALSARAGVASIHGPVVSQLGVLPAADLEALFTLLEVPEPRQVLTGLDELVPGQTEGPLLGGNLEVLTRLLGTRHQPDFSGTVLFIEEVGELPYRLDRLLTHLKSAGVLSAVNGIVIGDLTDCDSVEDGLVQLPTATNVVAERLGGLGIPVAQGGSFGHGESNSPLPYGTQVELDVSAGTLTSLESPVS